jgi:arylsulfatase A-like enzyme
MRTLACLLAFAAALPAARAADGEKLNVLMIAVDDLRPQLGCYGDPVVRSPHIDALAARGLVFERAYCQQAVCSPSRTSLLTGRRPDTTKVYDLQTHFRDTIPDVVTLPQHFKDHGYHTQGLSKIYHGGLDDAKSWSVPHWTPRLPGYGPEGQAIQRRAVAEAKAAGTEPAKAKAKGRANQPRGPAWEAPDVADNALPDGATADRAIEVLREVKDKPFFLAVGFLKPHLPFVAPKKYWDLYRPEQIKLADNPYKPMGSPPYALNDFGELRNYHGIPKQGPVSEDQARSLIHGYFAATSYTDAQIGRVLAELDRLGLRDKTVVVLWGDHGWQLGEHGTWCKHNNYETSTHATLVVAPPKYRHAGAKTKALVEFVDIYPTLADLCGLPLPSGLEGASFKPVLDAPGRPWKAAAFSQYPRGIPPHGRGMGHAVRTERFRLVEWTVPGTDYRAVELYDHQSDAGENVNVADRPEYARHVSVLRALLREGWKGALPKK